MGFERFGVNSYTSHTKLDAFVDYLDRGELRATRCKNCGKVYFPPRADCAGCLGNEMDWVEVKGKGSLVSYTRANYAPTGFENDVPYILALADFDGIKVFGRLNNSIAEEQIKVGMPVKINIVKLGEQVTYEFTAS